MASGHGRGVIDMRARLDNNQQGITIIELLIVLSIMGILAAIVIHNLSIFMDRARIMADQATLRNLNNTTAWYGIEEHTVHGDIFYGLDTDEERMEILLDERYLRAAVEPQKKGTEFSWHIGSQIWLHSLYEVAESSSASYALPGLSPDSYRKTGTWSMKTDGFYSNHGLLFFENNNIEYTITVRAILDSDEKYGGYGILFETILNDDNQDTGYVLQFDRGMGRGSILMRPRENGQEGNRITSHVFDHGNSFIPDKTTDEGKIWWETEHKITLKVDRVAGTAHEKQLSVWIDDRLLFDDFVFESNIASANNFTGFRSWTTGTTYKEMVIE
jgi:prepilin-type N-terminal cleavage/methylation domain-containing protein